MSASLLTAILLSADSLPGEPVAVKYMEGSVHGFLALRTPEGKVLAAGDLTQTVRGQRAVSHLVFRFRDGSIDDETAEFSQLGHFRLIRDHHIQRGPMFPTATDVLIEATTGEVTVHYTDGDTQKTETDHLDLPPDLANGIILDVMKNISPDAKETKLSYVAAAPKPRLVKLSIKPSGDETFSVAGGRHEAVHFIVKVELGGMEGLIAPLIGKEPADISVWVSLGAVPTFVKLEGPFYLTGPIWSVEIAGPVWKALRPEP